MDLKHIQGVGPAKQQKLKAAGIDSVEALARADVTAISAKSGIGAATIKQYKERAVALTLLEDIKGVGPQTVKTLAQSGVASLKDLYEASTDYVAKQAKVAQEQAQAWQAEAKKLADHVAAEAKTPEGRKKLAGEAKDAAQKAAAKTKQTAVELFHTVQKEGEAAIAKAKEIQQKAPGYAQEARDKAEKALKDAEAKVKELQGKAPEKVKDLQKKAEAAAQDAQKRVAELKDQLEKKAKAEGQKFKAANEGFFGRLKARFSK